MHSNAIIPEIIGLLFCTLALIVPVSGRFLELFRDRSTSERFFRITNQKGLDHIDVLNILKKIEEPDKVELCGVSVTKLLKYEDTTCKFEHLSDTELVNKRICNNNLGLETFLRHYAPELHLACEKNYFKILDEAFKEIPAEDVSNFKLLENKSIFVRLNIVEKAKQSMAKWEQDEIFPSCARLIQKMSVAVRDERWKLVWQKEGVKKPSWFDHWYNVLERCKIYTETQCEPYSSEPPKPAEDTSPQLFERIELCYAIRNKGSSDRALKSWQEGQEVKKREEEERLKEAEMIANNRYKFYQKKLIVK